MEIDRSDDRVGKSDWTDQDLLFHADAVARLTSELAVSRTELEVELAAPTSSTRAEKLRTRIEMMESRLSDAVRAAAASAG